MTNIKITAELVKKLRQASGASVMECRNALVDAHGNFERAADILRKSGHEKAAKKADRTTGEGVVAAYIHSNRKIGAMVELLCETDFVAKTPEFQELAHDLAMHVAASDPKYLSPENAEAGEFNASEKALLAQPFVKNPDVSVEDLVKEKIAKIGENIQIRNFARFEI